MDDLLTIAKKHVLQGYENYAELLSKMSALEVHLNDVFGSRGPSMHDYDNRRDLIRIFNEIAKEIYGTSSDCPVVEEFGSFLMDMFNAKSDLDLSINFRDKIVEARRDAKIKALRRFANKFYVLQKKKHVTNVQPILSAKVPVLKVTDCGTGIECDLSVGNVDGIAKSNIILMISSIDERFKKLCFLVLPKRTNVPGMKQYRGRRFNPYMAFRPRRPFPPPYFYSPYGYGKAPRFRRPNRYMPYY